MVGISSQFSLFYLLHCVPLESSFTEWLFEEAAKGVAVAGPSESAPPAEVEPQTAESSSKRAVPTSSQPPTQSRSGNGSGGVYQQALTQALNPPSSSSNKRTASARSPSPNGGNHPSKVRRTEAPPTGPRAMARGAGGEGRSLIDRMAPRSHNNQRDDIQNRIDSITHQTGQQNVGAPAPNMDMMMQMSNFPGAPDMNALAMNPNMTPMMLQEIMMNQMALMAQISGMMGPGQFPGGFPQGMQPADMNALAAQQGFQAPQGGGRGRGNGRGRGGRGRGGVTHGDNNRISEVPAETPAIVVPVPRSTGIPSADAVARLPYALPERPQSPTLCKFAAKCTNAQCRYSHPSPVATPESGMVLSNDHCEKGKNCKDQDCVKAHVSPAVLNPQRTSKYLLLCCEGTLTRL
jgi:nuclear polyadenylated RNA-binding protein NAB2